MTTRPFPKFLASALACVLAVAAYFYALDGIYIPHIGDEAPYIEIARLTGESGQWLPLVTGPGLENTKPPLLFWLGIASTRLASDFSLFWLRFPIVLVTFATAAVVFLVTKTVASSPTTAFLAALSFLGFHSSFQYGRPFLTNSPETLFLFSSFAVLLLAPGACPGLRRFVAMGVLLGAACLFKSFALVGPAGAAFAGTMLLDADGRLGRFLARAVPGIFVATMIALGLFALWPLADPDPSAILHHFVLEENFGKLEGDGYVRGLFGGAYPLHRLWLGPFANAGLLALPLVFLGVESWRSRESLRREEKALWIYVVAFLVVYSIPSQRQENYLLPVMPALAVLLSLRWRALGSGWMRVATLPGIAIGVAFVVAMFAVRSDIVPPGSYAGWQLAVPLATAVGWAAAFVSPKLGRNGFHALVFATYLSLACATAPFEAAPGRFDPDRVARLEGRVVHVPESFLRRHERHRFLLPGVMIEGYDPLDTVRVNRLLDDGELVVIHRSLSDTATGPFRVFARRLDLRSRLSFDEARRVALGGELDLLIRQELVVRKFSAQRLRERS